MKVLITQIIITLLLYNFAYADEIKIYDTGKIEDKKYFNEKAGENVYAKEIKYIGKAKAISKIRDSEARIIITNEKIVANIVNWVKKEKTNNDVNRGTNLARIVDIVSIGKPACVEIKLRSGGYNIIILDGTFIGKITKDGPFEKDDEPQNIVWIGKYDHLNNRITETMFCDLSISSIYDTRRHVSVEAVADIDNDGAHEIIINDTRYAGFSYYIVHFDNSRYFIKELYADGWD